MTRRPPSSKPQARNLIAFSALIMVLFCVIVAYQASRSYEIAVDAGRSDAERLMRSLSDHVDLTFLAVDMNIRRAVERQYFNDLFGGKLPKDMENNMRLWVQQTPQIAALFMTDAAGNITIQAARNGYEPLSGDVQELLRKQFFADVRDGSDNHLFIGFSPSRLPAANGSEPQERSMVYLARKLTSIDGSFGGMVIGAIDPIYFLQFFRSVETGAESFMALAMNNGEVLVSGPSQEQENFDLIRQVHNQLGDVNDIKALTDVQTVNNSIKIYAYHHLPRAPVFIAVVLDEQDFLRDWSTDRVKDIGFLAIFAIFGSVLSFFALTMAKQIRRVEESEAAAVLASQAKSEFLANMSHELRTPLNAIIGFSEMMDSGYFGQLNTKQQERIHDINLCGNHLLQLINDILEFSKGEAGKLELKEEDVALNEIAYEVSRIIGDKAKSKGIHLEVDVPQNLPFFLGDKRKVRQILLNLLSNSIKFTNKDGIITVRARVDANDHIVIAVIDTGIGIAEDDIPKALSVFGQVHRNLSHEGTGLGLPLCRMFVELHGGKLTLESKVGHGTKVQAIFPASRTLRKPAPSQVVAA